MKHKDCGGRVVIVELLFRTTPIEKITDGIATFNVFAGDSTEEVEKHWLECPWCSQKLADDEVEED